MQKSINNVGGLLVNDITDHLPIFAFCDYPDLKRQEKKLHTKKRVINKNTIDLLADNLSEIDWDNVLNLSEVDLAYNAFLSTFVHLYTINVVLSDYLNIFHVKMINHG